MKQRTLYFTLALIAGLFAAGCDKDDPVSSGDSSILYEDAAESISAAVGDESGGAVDSYADVMTVAGGGSFGASLSKSGGVETVNASVPVYDPATGWWTVTVDRSRSNMVTSASVHRLYQYQFQKNGTVQQFRISGSDTATTLKFKVVDGSGSFVGPRVKHYLQMVKGGWTITDLNKDTVTLNSDTVYVRTAVDSIITRNMQRTFSHTLRITSMTNVRGPKFRMNRDNYTNWRNNFSKAVSGTIEGTFTGNITMQNGDLYKERTIDKTFTITLGGGDGNISIAGDGRKFGCDLGGGQRKP